MGGAFSVKFLNSLDRLDVDDVVAVSFLDNEIYVKRDDDQGWVEVASLRKQVLYAEHCTNGQSIGYSYRIMHVSDGEVGQGRFTLVGVAGGDKHPIWDDVECVQGDQNGLFVYARGRSSGFHLDWVAEEGCWQFRDGPIYDDKPREGLLFNEVLLSRHAPDPRSPRGRLGALAGG